jgi:quinol monooxygenase YgiN
MMSTKVIIESTIKSESLGELLPFLEVNLPNVRGFPGCLNVTIFLNKESGDLIIDEEWLTVDDHKEYIETISSNGIMNELISFLQSPPAIKYLDRVVM